MAYRITRKRREVLAAMRAAKAARRDKLLDDWVALLGAYHKKEE